MADSAVMKLPVDEYRNHGSYVSIKEWDSLTECAMHHKVKQATIKNLIHFGGSMDGYTTFDIPATCQMDTRIKVTGIIEIYNETTGAKLDGNYSRRRPMPKARGAIA